MMLTGVVQNLGGLITCRVVLGSEYKETDTSRERGA